MKIFVSPLYKDDVKRGETTQLIQFVKVKLV